MFALARRYRVDGRLPPVVSAVYRDWARATLAVAVARTSARVRPVVGRGRRGTVVREERRRLVAMDGPVPSIDRAAHDNLRDVLALLNDAGLEPFVVDRDGDRFRVGLPLDDRERAARGVARLRAADGWYATWSHGHRHGLIDPTRRSARRRLARSTRWHLFRARAFGDVAIGHDAGVEVGFWSPGTSGQLELIGTRGQERFHETSPVTDLTLGGVDVTGRLAFPMEHRIDRFDGEVDVVFTWVDGDDATWREEFVRWAKADERDPGTDSAISAGRYRSRDELRYSLRSVHLFMGWVRRIWVVTAGQRPTWLADDDRIRVVDHREILEPSCLPTFNSHAIEASLHHVPGLAEHYVYFNDDMFIGRPVRPEHFFTSNGLPYVFDSDARVFSIEDGGTGAVDTAAIRGRDRLLDRFGTTSVFKPLHSPYPMRRSTMEELDATFPDDFDRTRHSRFRSPRDLSTASSLGLHYGIATGRAVLGSIDHMYVNIESGRLGVHLDLLLRSRSIATFCLNETDQRSDHPDRVDARVRRFLAAYYPAPAPWERSGGVT